MSTPSPSPIIQPQRPAKPTGRVLTSEQIADHLEAFRKAGGTVDVLGTTPTFKHIGVTAPAAVPAPAAAKKR